MEEQGFREGLLRFSDSLIASTSTESDQILVWESQTLAPLEQLKSDKFIVGPNTLQADYKGFVVGSHIQKTTLAAWKWDKPSQPCLRSPTKEELSVVRLVGNSCGQQMLICGTKKGKILVYHVSNGNLVAEIEGAHFLAINDIDVTEKRGT